MNEIKSNFKLKIIGFIFVVYVIVKSILFFDPFDPSVWGNVSDWFMVIVTILTAIYLIKTFDEQRLVTKIEQDNFRLRFLPKIKLTFTENYLGLKIEDQPIKKYSIHFLSDNKFSFKDEWMANGNRNMDLHVGHTHMIGFEDSNRPRLRPYETMTISFLDSQNNYYTQKAHMFASTHEINIQSPVFIRRLESESEFDAALQNRL
jgi:hypothetical protein